MNNHFQILLNKNFKTNKPQKKTILITGSSGFIGDYLVQALTHLNFKNCKIYGIDIVNPKQKYKNFFFKKKSLYKIEKKDLQKKKFDYVIHLAGIPSPVYYKKNPLGTIFLNLNLAEMLMQKACEDKSNFLYFSSSEIYGNPDPKFIPTKEIYPGFVSSISDRSCYDESKRMGETLAYIYKTTKNLKAKIIRPFNFYGNGMRADDKRIIPQFFNQAINGKKITVFASGKQTRTYCHIYDAVIMILKIMFYGKNFVYNVGNSNDEISALDLAFKIKKVCKDKKVKIAKIPYPKNYPSDEPQRRCPDLTLFLKEFGYKPSISINEGLKEFKEYALKFY